jgi:hypothetical protein
MPDCSRASEVFNAPSHFLSKASAKQKITEEVADKVLEQTVESTLGGVGTDKAKAAKPMEVDEFELLNMKIDPKDFVSLRQRAKLEEELYFETARLKAKAAFKASKDISNPMKIDL